MNEEQLKYYKLTKVTQRDIDEGVWDAEHKGLYSKDGKRFLMYQRPMEHVGIGKEDVFTFMPGVEIICDKAFEHGSFLKDFKLPDTIVAIGDHALAHVMRSGERLVFPKSIKYFGAHVFGHSEGVFEIEFEEGFKEVDFGDVLEFGSAITVHIPSTLTSIGSYWGSNITAAIHVAEGNKYFCVDNEVLYNYNKTKMLRCPVTKRGELVVPEGVTSICKNAFAWISAHNIDASTIGLPKLSVILPQSLERIETGAFWCSHLNSLYIGPKVSVIENKAFEYHFIREIIVSPDNPNYESYQGMLIDKRLNKLITISGSFTGKDINYKNFEVKNNVLIDKKRKTALLTIGFSSDGSNAYLSVWPEDNVKPIHNSSRDLIIPEGVEVVDSNALSNGGYDNIVIPEGVTYIGEGAFRYMHAKSISLPSTLCYLTPSTMFIDQQFPFWEGMFYFYVPKGMLKKYENIGLGHSMIERFFREVENKDGTLAIEETKADYLEQYAIATDDDLKQSVVDKHMVRYSQDGTKLIKYEGFHSRFSTYWVEKGTEVICNNATASDRYQTVRTLIIPSTVKYIGSCPSFDRLLLCGNEVKIAASTISLRKNDTVYVPCGTWVYYHNELEKARRGNAPKPKYSWSNKIEDYRLVELSKSSVIMYLKQQEQILTDIVRSTNLVSEYTMYTINGDSKKNYVCYRDTNKLFFLETEQISVYRPYLLKVLSVLGYSYQDIMDILEVDIDEIKVSKKNKSLLFNRKLAHNVIYSWNEDFVDEDTGDIISIQRNEIILYRGTVLGEEEIQTILDFKIPSVSVMHDFESRDIEYLHYFANYYEPNETAYSIADRNSVLKQFFPGKKVKLISTEEKRALAYNLTIMMKSIIDYGYTEENIMPLKTKENELHTNVSEEEENLAKLISEYYRVLINKVRSCDREMDVMPIFPITQDYRELRSYLVSHNVDEHLIDSIVTPAINMIQIE